MISINTPKFFVLALILVISSLMLTYQGLVRTDSETFLFGWVVSIIFVVFVFIFPKFSFFNYNQIFSPINFAHFSFILQICISPIFPLFDGVYASTVLPYIPEHEYIELAIYVVLFAYFFFILALNLFMANTRDKTTNKEVLVKPLGKPNYSIICFSLFAFFGSVSALYGSFANYITDSWRVSSNFEIIGANPVLSFLTGTGKQMGVFLIFYLWYYYYSKGLGKNRVFWLITFCCLIIMASLGTNRANVVFPLVAFLGVITNRYFRIPAFVFTWMLGIMIFGIVIFGYLRSDRQNEEISFTSRLSEFVQVYANSPQFSGFALEKMDQISDRSSIISSIMYPVPSLGAPFRSTSTNSAYNYVVYGIPEARDQYVVSVIEVFIHLGWFGILIYSVLIAGIFSILEKKFRGSFSAPTYITFSIYLISIYSCALIILNISVFSQFFIYNAPVPFLILIFYSLQNIRMGVNHENITHRA
jgi:hypothetical protein